jgi:hypothetical protein
VGQGGRHRGVGGTAPAAAVEGGWGPVGLAAGAVTMWVGMRQSCRADAAGLLEGGSVLVSGPFGGGGGAVLSHVWTRVCRCWGVGFVSHSVL